MSSKFLDGPAKGKTLELERTPIYLRVVIDEAGIDMTLILQQEG